MTDAQTELLRKAKHGIAITPADVVATINHPDELAAYQDGLKRRGALTADAMKAIQDRSHLISMRSK